MAKRTIWFHGATIVALRQQLTDDAWLGVDEDGADSTVRVAIPGVAGAATVNYAPLNEAHQCPPNTDCP